MATVNWKYNRSEIYNFFDLTEQEQEQVLNDYCLETEQAETDSFVCYRYGKENEKKQFIPLSLFIRSSGKRWDGIHGESYFSAYFIKLNRSNDEAVIAYNYF
jgi:hypothetical protein